MTHENVNYLKTLGFIVSPYDPGLLFHPAKHIYLTLHVDDSRIYAENPDDLHELEDSNAPHTPMVTGIHLDFSPASEDEPDLDHGFTHTNIIHCKLSNRWQEVLQSIMNRPAVADQGQQNWRSRRQRSWYHYEIS